MYNTYFIHNGEVYIWEHLGDANIGAKGISSSGGEGGNSFSTKEEAEKKLKEDKTEIL